MSVNYPFDLGLSSAHNVVSLKCHSNMTDATVLEEINAWFQRGMVWYYGFNHEEAIECFKQLLLLDATCAMAHWGISISHGPNYNVKYMEFNKFPSATAAWEHARLSIDAVKAHQPPLDIALIEALQCRYVDVSSFSHPAAAESMEPISQNSLEYTNAMRAVYNAYPEDPCVAALFAESLLNLDPWRLYDPITQAPRDFTAEALEVIEQSLSINPRHPGLLHFLVHVLEMSPFPEKGMLYTPSLRTCYPDVGHLIHMASHLSCVEGRWLEVVAINQQAHLADRKYLDYRGCDNYYAGYCCHDLMFTVYGAMMAGQFRTAFSAAETISSLLPDRVLEDRAMAQFCESYRAVELHVLIRFGKWQEILTRPTPVKTELLRYTICVHHYARGLAYAVLGQVAEAKLEQQQLATLGPLVPADRAVHNNLCIDLLPIAAAMLEGEILYRTKAYDEAFSALRVAVQLSDDLAYDEPRGWMQPPRHALGALLLEQGRVKEAEVEFRRDMDKSVFLKSHPDNIWSLSGLLRCLDTRRGSAAEAMVGGEVEDRHVYKVEVEDIRNKLSALRAESDVEIRVACMCACAGRKLA